MTAAVASSCASGQEPQAPCPARRLAYRLGSSTLALDVNDPVSLEIVERVYEPMRREAARGRVLNASMRRMADGRLHARFGRRVVSCAQVSGDSASRNAYNAAREIFARFASAVDGTVAFYGAAVAVKHAGVLILGSATIGKTLLALHLAHQGATFLGDETAMLSLRDSELFAMPRRPSLRESALPLLPSDAMRTAVTAASTVFPGELGRFWYALGERDLQGITPSERALPLRAVCIIRDRGEKVSARRIELAAALPSIAQRAYARPAELNQLAMLHKALRGAMCLEITLGAPDASASALLREVGACV